MRKSEFLRELRELVQGRVDSLVLDVAKGLGDTKMNEKLLAFNGRMMRILDNKETTDDRKKYERYLLTR